MAIISNVTEVLHRIRVKLYPNYLPNSEGTYIARTNNEASLNIEQVCSSMKNRGGFTGKFEDVVEHVRQFFDEAAYQLCDGFAINTGYYSIHPNIGGTFGSVKDSYDREKNPITFRFQPRLKLRRLADHIAIEIEGEADTHGFIDEFIDVSSDTDNEIVTSGGQFCITGHKIKIAGDDPAVGVYFVSAADGSREVKVADRLADNSPSKLIGIIPPLCSGTWKVAIKTQFAGSGGIFLKNVRVMTGGFELSAPGPL